MDFVKSTISFICLFNIWSSVALAESTYGENIEQAISILKTMCVTGGSSWNMEATGDGGLMLRKIGASASVRLNKKELEGFADAASKINAQQATEMRECMKPYIDRIIGTVLSGGSSAGPAKVEIDTKGYPFVIAEFDRIIAVVASYPKLLLIESIAKSTGFSEAKTIHYLLLAQDNNMGVYIKSGTPVSSVGDRYYTEDGFKIGQKGISYAISRGLIN